MGEPAIIEQKKITGARPYFHDVDMPEILDRIEKVLRGGRLIFGDNTSEFEESFRHYVGTENAVSVNSCTTALEIALRFYDVRSREVIVPTNTFASVVNAITYAGGIPILADMDPTTFCLDTEDALSRITSRTAGIITVHIAGLIDPQIDRLYDAARQNGLFLIEDVSHAHGAVVGQRKAGSLTDVACFSFYPTKIMTTGTGGMLTTDNADMAFYARSLRHHGQGESLENIINLGNDWCMTELGAVLGIYQLKRLEENVGYRNQIVQWYRRELAGVDWIDIPSYSADFRHAYYKFPVLLAPRVNKTRLRQVLLEKFKIEVGSIYDPPCHLHPLFRKQLGCFEGMFPRTESILHRQVCLPVHAKITQNDVVGIVATLKQTVAQCIAE